MHENTKYFLFFKTLRARGQFSPLPMQPLIVYQLTVQMPMDTAVHVNSKGSLTLLSAIQSQPKFVKLIF